MLQRLIVDNSFWLCTKVQRVTSQIRPDVVQTRALPWIHQICWDETCGVHVQLLYVISGSCEAQIICHVNLPKSQRHLTETKESMPHTSPDNKTCVTATHWINSSYSPPWQCWQKMYISREWALHFAWPIWQSQDSNSVLQLDPDRLNPTYC